MAWKSLGQKLRASVDELERSRLSERFKGLDLTDLADLVPRTAVRVGGEVARVVTAPRHGIATLEIMINDGTGTATAVFTGRRSILGLEHGRAVILSGVAVPEKDRNVLYNPIYTLIA